MKKYNMSEIMTRAWEIKRTDNTDMSTALKKSWAVAKAPVAEKKEFTGFAKVPKCYNGEISQTIGTQNESASDFLVLKGWNKAGKVRVYMSDYKGRSMGYIDMVAGTVDADSAYGRETAKLFLESYDTSKYMETATN